QAAEMLGVPLQSLPVREAADLDGAFEAATQEGAGGLLTFQGGSTGLYRTRIVELAMRYKLPSMFGERAWVEAGGLMAYGANSPDLARRAATYVDKILKGAKPADLPVEQPMRFDFIVNQKIARELGITFPEPIRLQVTEAIE